MALPLRPPPPILNVHLKKRLKVKDNNCIDGMPVLMARPPVLIWSAGAAVLEIVTSAKPWFNDTDDRDFT